MMCSRCGEIFLQSIVVELCTISNSRCGEKHNFPRRDRSTTIQCLVPQRSYFQNVLQRRGCDKILRFQYKCIFFSFSLSPSTFSLFFDSPCGISLRGDISPASRRRKPSRCSFLFLLPLPSISQPCLSLPFSISPLLLFPTDFLHQYMCIL